MEISIEIESGDKCEHCGQMKPEKPQSSKDALLAELKGLLAKNDANGQADRQMKIDELIGKISELGED